MNLSFNDLDDLKKHLAESLESSFDKQMSPIVRQVEAATTRVAAVEAVQKSIIEDVGRLKANQMKALAVWTLMIAAIGAGVTYGFNYLKAFIATHLHLS